jgi:hypothetical protein
MGLGQRGLRFRCGRLDLVDDQVDLREVDLWEVDLWEPDLWELDLWELDSRELDVWELDLPHTLDRRLCGRLARSRA